MDKWLVVWHEAECEPSYFFMEGDDISEELAEAEILKMQDVEDVSDEHYIDYIFNMTALCKDLEHEHEHENQIALIWHIDDVQETRPDLTDEQCREVLARVKDRHDPDLGVSWDILEVNADYLYPLNEEVDA